MHVCDRCGREVQVTYNHKVWLCAPCLRLLAQYPHDAYADEILEIRQNVKERT